MIRHLLIDRQNWHKVAVIAGEKVVSYRELARQARAIQNLLPRHVAENVAILLPNGSDYIAAFFGTIMLGLTALPLSAAMTKHEIIPLLKQASVHTLITADKFRPFFTDLAPDEAPAVNIIYVEELPADNGGLPLTVEVEPNQPMVLFSTSGTTGKSKIVQLSENNVAAAVDGYIDKMDYAGIEDVRYTLGIPFSSAYGLMILSVCLSHSFPIVLLNDNLTLEAFYQTVEARRVTHYEGGAALVLMMEQLAGRPLPYDISCLKYLAFGGSKVAAQTIERLLDAYPGREFYQGYGMTEAAPLITKRPLKPGSVGVAIKGLEIAFESGGKFSHAPHTEGEIVVKGPNVMLGYYQNPEETQRVLKDGYLYTGDIGYADESGHLYICGRKKNIIIIRGFNVHPEEVEECILTSSLAKDCYVYGLADSLGHEIICADVAPVAEQVTAAEIRAYCHAHLAGYKQPQIIHICAEITKNAAGKTARASGDK